MRSSVSMLTPKAFSIRKAISADNAARPLNRAERAGRVTPSTLAASVTDSLWGSTISARMKRPGWEGLAIRMLYS
jgi:hypothetical protein